MYRLLDNIEIKDLIDETPKILMFDSYNDTHSFSNKEFKMFNNLPEDIRLKIGNMANSQSIFRTEKSYLNTQSGKENFYDNFCTNIGPTLEELNEYIRGLPKNIKTPIGCLLIFKNHNSYKIEWLIVQIELTEKNKLNIYKYEMEKIKTLITFSSFIDFCVNYARLSVDYELVNVLFDFHTIKSIAAKRKVCMEVDGLYDHKYTYYYTNTVLKYFEDYFGPLSAFLSISLMALGYNIEDDLYVDNIRANQGFGSYFFVSNDGKKEQLLSSYSKFVLDKLRGPNNSYVEKRFVS